jgi:hypothetical protein
MRRKNPPSTLMYLIALIGSFAVTRYLIASPQPQPQSSPPSNPPPNNPPSNNPLPLVDKTPPSQQFLPLGTNPPSRACHVSNWGNERVLLIGDSLAFMLGARFLKPALESRGVGAYLDISKGGTMINVWAWPNSYQKARDLEAALRDFRPTLVLISLGTNDEAFRGTTDYKGDPMKPPYGPNFDVANLRKDSIPKLRQTLSGVRSVWLGPPKMTKWRMDRNFRNLIERNWGDCFFNTEIVDPGKTDDIHFSDSGNRKWLAAILKFLEG